MLQVPVLASTLAKYLAESEKMTVEEAFDVIATNYGEMSLFDLKSAIARTKISDSQAQIETLYMVMDKQGRGRVSKADWCHVLSSADFPAGSANHSPVKSTGVLDLSIDITEANNEQTILSCDQRHSGVEERKFVTKLDGRTCCDTCWKRKLADTCELQAGGTCFWCNSCDADMCGRWISAEEEYLFLHRTSEERRARTLRVFSVALSIQCRDALSDKDFFDAKKRDFPMQTMS